MIDLLRRHVAFIASLAIGWSGYSFYDGGTAKAAAQAKGQVDGLDPVCLALRDPSVPLHVSADPYRIEVEPVTSAAEAEGAALALPAEDAAFAAVAVGDAPDANDTSHADTVATRATQVELVQAFAGALREIAGAARDIFSDDEPAPAAAEPRPVGFTLLVQSTLDMEPAGQARINGRTVAEGEAMPFLDPLDPPVLLSVDGTAIVVRHAGRDYEADLLARPLLQVGDPALAVASSAPAQPSATKPAATKGAAPKSNGGYRVRGKSTSKKKP